MAIQGNLSVVHSFFGNDGAWPRGTLSLSTQNPSLLYGFTSLGGTNSVGSIFSLNLSAPENPVFTSLYSFSTTTGMMPHHNAMLVLANQDGGETLYGAALYDGSNGNIANKADDLDLQNGSASQTTENLPPPPVYSKIGNGALFSFNAGNYTVLYEFQGQPNDGANPHSPFYYSSTSTPAVGYGMTAKGGTKDHGTIYQVSLSPFEISVIYSFHKSSGDEPHGMVVMAADGTLYGMTKKGGAYDAGVIFSFVPETLTYTDLWDFNANDPTNGATNSHGYLLPYTNAAGVTSYYGTTSAGGAYSLGTLFSYTPSTGSFNILHSFGANTNDGNTSYGSLILVNGVMYGTTKLGGVNQVGTIFSYDPVAQQYTSLASFDLGTTGGGPEDCLVAVTSSQQTTLYGTTQTGGVNDQSGENYYGTVFAYTI